MSGLDDAFTDDRRLWAVSAGALVVIGIAVIGGGLVLLDGSPNGNGASRPTATPTVDGGGGEPTSASLPAGDPLDGTRSLDAAAVTVEGNGSDEFGFAPAVGDVNGDGVPDVVVGAPLHNASAPRSGAVFAFFGPVTGADLSVDDADARLAGESWGDWAGNSVAVADVDGDGVDDVVVGAPRNNGGARNGGAVYVVHGGAGLDGTVPLGSADAKLAGVVPRSLTGYSVAAADLTGDGRAEVVAGSPRNGTGRAYLVDGERVGSVDSLAAADATFVGEAAGDEAGWSVDVTAAATGEGDPAVVVGAPRNGAAGEAAGAAYAVTAFDGTVPLGDADRVLRGPAAGALAGWSVAGPGDVDGDGDADLLVGAPGASEGGAAYLVGGGSDAGSLADATAFAGAAGDRAGSTVDAAGDANCDGRPDLLVGAPGNDAGGTDAGAAYVVVADASTPLPEAAAVLTGAEAGDEVGHATGFGTVPGDGTTGLVVGAPFGETPQTAHVVYAGCPAE